MDSIACNIANDRATATKRTTVAGVLSRYASLRRKSWILSCSIAFAIKTTPPAWIAIVIAMSAKLQSQLASHVPQSCIVRQHLCHKPKISSVGFFISGASYTRYLLGGLSICKDVVALEGSEIDGARLDSCCLVFVPGITAQCNGRATVGGIDRKRDALIAALGGNRSTRRSRSVPKERPARV